jgi:hypothetical protein
MKGRGIALFLALAGLLLLAGCQQETVLQVVAEVDNEDGGATVAVFLIEGMSFYTDADVTVNGQPLGLEWFFYSAALPEIMAGAAVTLGVEWDSGSVNRTLTMPPRPTVTAPTASTYSAAAALSVAWNSLSGQVDEVMVHVSDDYTPGEDNAYLAELPDSATSHQIPAYTLSAGLTGVEVGVGGVNMTTDLGEDVASGSTYMLLNIGESEPFDTN